jgi:hypothetical protein
MMAEMAENPKRLALARGGCRRRGRKRLEGGSPAEKDHQRVEQGLQIVLALVDRWRRGAALREGVDCLPRRSDGAFDGEGNFPRNLDVLTDESEVGRLAGTGGGLSVRLRGSQILLT